ncbi:ABC1 kinase family protein [Cerasibacillus terrae]|uniref:ABC1 kinase family protein n=1 Tax=Cerasibacillus terrae TaxID=2498845 RepID=UPI0017479915|nr:AarF/ABC1/UbiB kinase family protein [Cerasibacillus terrae]
MLEKRIRHLQRYRDIVVAFSRNGFGYIADEMGLLDLVSLPKRILSHNDYEIEKKSVGERIRLILEELGPTFVKLGQFASTRPDILPENVIRELEKLQDDVGAFPYEEVRDIIETELEKPLETIFAEFEETPLAAASIGQVHYAILHSNDEVAVKIQRPRIHRVVNTDLEILQDLAVLAEKRLDWAERYQVCQIVEEFEKSLKKELNYMQEGRSGERIAFSFEEDKSIHVPEIYWDYTTDKVLVMEYVSGTKLSDEEKLKEKGINRTTLAKRFVEAMFQQVFVDGFFHADPHPGNILALPDEKIIFMDFGMVGHLTPQTQDDLGTFVIALMRQDTDGIMKALMQLGMISDEVDMNSLYQDIEQLRLKYYDVPLSSVSLSEAIEDLFAVSYEHRIHIPSELTLLGKTLLTIEGIVEKLDPELSIVKMAEPFGRELIKRKVHPKKVVGDMFKYFLEYKELVTEFPSSVKKLKEVVKKGKFRMEITIPELDRSLKKLDRISNRLSFSIVLLAFSIVMAGLLVGSALVRQSTLLWNIPVIEIGFVMAAIMFLWIIFAIFRSGRF